MLATHAATSSQALLYALATHAATPSQYSFTESAEGINRGGSERRGEDGPRAHFIYNRGRPEGAAPASLLCSDPADKHPLAQRCLWRSWVSNRIDQQ